MNPAMLRSDNRLSTAPVSMGTVSATPSLALQEVTLNPEGDCILISRQTSFHYLLLVFHRLTNHAQ